MPEPTYTLGIEFATGSFTNITSRVERASWSSAIVDMFSPPSARQAMFELGNDDGAMSSRVNSSFIPGKAMQFSAVHSGISYPLWRGRITDISLSSALGKRTTIVEGIDDWDRLSQVKYNTALMSGSNVSSVFTVLMSLSAVASFAQSVPADDAVSYAWYSDVPAQEAIHELVRAGNYVLNLDGNNTMSLRPRGWSTFTGSNAPTINVASFNALDVRYSYSNGSVKNRAKLGGQTRQQFSSVSTLSAIYKPVSLPASSSAGYWHHFRDPGDVSGGSETPASSLVTRVASTDYYIAANSDGTGTDLTSGCSVTFTGYGASAVTTITNNTGINGWIVRDQVRGYPLRVVAQLKAQVDVASSQTRYGERTVEFESRLLQNQEQINAIAAALIDDLKDGVIKASLPISNDFPFVLAYSNGDVFELRDAFSGPPTTWRIRGASHDLSLVNGLQHNVTYDLETYPVAWGWGVPQVPGNALFAGGETAASTQTSYIDKYVLSGDQVVPGTALLRALADGSAAGNASVGLFTGDIVSSGTVNKYTYVGDTVSAGTSLTATGDGDSRGKCAAASSLTACIFGYGYELAIVNTTEKYTYATDATAAGGDLGTAIQYPAAVGTVSVGIFGGGETAVPAYTNKTSVYTYTADTSANGTNLTVARSQLAAVGSPEFGFFAGGYTGAASAVVDRYSYASSAVAASTSLAAARRELAGGGSYTTGIFGGGNTGSIVASTVKMTFSSGAVAAGTALSLARQLLSATSSNPGGLAFDPLAFAVFVLFGGGNAAAAVTNYTDKYVVLSDSVSAGTVLSVAQDLWGAAGNTLYGVFAGGRDSGAANSAISSKYTYATDGAAAGTSLGTARQRLCATGTDVTGLFAGGLIVASSALTDRYTYSNDVVAAGTNLGTARRVPAAAGNSTRAIIGAGFTTVDVLSTEKYTYSNDAVVAGTNLGTARNGLAAVGTSTAGIFAGGIIGSTPSAVSDKYTYSNDTVAAGTSLGTARFYLSAGGTSETGVFGGGYIAADSAVTDKYTFTTDAVGGGTALGLARFGLAATCSTPGAFEIASSYALFGCGGNGGGTNYDYTDKYSYVNNYAVPGTALGTARAFLAAVGNWTAGIFGGGSVNGASSLTTTKYTYVGDGVTAGTSLGNSNQSRAAAGNATRGIFAAGYLTTATDKYTYSGDAVAAGTALGTARVAPAAAGTATVGIFACGDINAGQSNTSDKYTYATDGVAAGTALGNFGAYRAASGNATRGIFASGIVGFPTRYTDKYTYSGDSVAAGTALATARYGLAAASNTTVGMYGGGQMPLTPVVESYTFATDAVALGSNLGQTRSMLAATSSTPGGF